MSGASRPSRLKIGSGLHKAARKLDMAVDKDPLKKAFRNFIANSNLAALKFQKVAGTANFWKFRITLSLHVLLRQEEDEQGKYFLAVDIQDHDDYRK